MAKKIKLKDALKNSGIPYLIGETAYIHEGDFNYLSKLVNELIRKKSCDGIKFHILIDIDSYMTSEHKIYGTIKKFLLTKQQWAKMLKKAKKNNFETIVLADDLKAIDFVKENTDLIDAIELHAIALNNIEMLEKVKDVKIPIILGIGGSKISDIEFAVKYLNRKDVLLMHGFQNYPTKYEYINFEKMLRIKDKFNLQVGYADHTSWDNKSNELVTLAGFVLGANIIEKHTTLKLGEKRTDSEAAVDVDVLRDIKDKMEILNKTKGDGSFEISEYENIYAKNGPMKFTIVANKDLKKGKKIAKEDITFRRTKEVNTIRQREYLNLIGKRARQDISKYSLINWNNIEK